MAAIPAALRGNPMEGLSAARQVTSASGRAAPRKWGKGDPHSWPHWVLEGPQSLARGPRDLRTCAK